ncbi:MAG TPA: putative DNA-binding domain-containing protein [Acidobacteriaceae bacterium]|nr:putative DNA-binding domain-containing protein [Acidobacteriaceae bacterium]
MTAAQNPSLLEIQRRMAAAVMHPLTRDETMPRRRRDGASNQSEADAIIRPNDRLTSFERLEIYNRQYWFRLYTSFEEDFPGLQAIVGRPKFDALMRAYLTDCPSESFSLRNLGSRLEAWLEEHPRLIEPHAELARDMVRLEWAHIEAFDSEETTPLGAEAFVRLGEESKLRLQPHIRLLELSYPVDDLLLQVRTANGSSASSTNNASTARKRRHVRHAAALAPRPMHLAVHRHQNSVWYKPLAPEEFRLLAALRDEKPLGEAMELAFAGSGIPEDDRTGFLQAAFANWAMLGWFAQSWLGSGKHEVRFS